MKLITTGATAVCLMIGSVLLGSCSSTASPPPPAAPSTPLTITTTSLPDGTVGVPYSFKLEASGGSGSYSWGSRGMPLPAGLTLDIKTGIISGTPASAVTSYLVVYVGDSAGADVSKNLTLTVKAP